MATKTKQTARKSDDSIGFTSANYILFAIGIVVIVIGFISLRMGSITLAPILLVFGYCVVIPTAIMYRGKKEDSAGAAKSDAEA
ncbi:MAG: hypothetical protein GF307_01950 [candidate division Zixibacteria bacterium]|nr:hypothetical protein [candidate division Zixibacteria bacterium]